MCSDSAIAIKATGIGKCYQLYDKPIQRVMDLVLPGEAKRYQPFWALKEVSFEIPKGKTVGIIGRNGSGKSTLLEIISDTLQPTTGSLEVNGRIAALLELGAGFNPEFTGRENVIMNAAIMGIPEDRVRDKMEDIVAFANIGDHINHPVKTYSSGMYVRLAFATSIHMDPDILIVDEALAVGDIRFQRKCFREFESFKRAGKTILFVTHAVELVRSYCDAAIFLDQGEIRSIGEPREVVYDYLDMLFGSKEGEAPTPKNTPTNKARPTRRVTQAAELSTDPEVDAAAGRRSFNSAEYRWGTGQAKIIDYLLQSGDEKDPVVVMQGDIAKVTMRVYFEEALDDLIYGITLKTLDGTTVYGANTRDREIATGKRTAGELVDIEFVLDLNLIQATYFVSLGVAVDDEGVDNLAIDRRYDVFSFSLHGDVRDFGIADLNASISETDVELPLADG